LKAKHNSRRHGNDNDSFELAATVVAGETTWRIDEHAELIGAFVQINNAVKNLV